MWMYFFLGPNFLGGGKALALLDMNSVYSILQSRTFSVSNCGVTLCTVMKQSGKHLSEQKGLLPITYVLSFEPLFLFIHLSKTEHGFSTLQKGVYHTSPFPIPSSPFSFPCPFPLTDQTTSKPPLPHPHHHPLYPHRPPQTSSPPPPTSSAQPSPAPQTPSQTATPPYPLDSTPPPSPLPRSVNPWVAGGRGRRALWRGGPAGCGVPLRRGVCGGWGGRLLPRRRMLMGWWWN